MSIVQSRNQRQWPLLILLSLVLVAAFEDPKEAQQCRHDSIPDLIKSSPVILKALGARIFTDYENYPLQDEIQVTEELILKAQQKDTVDVPTRMTTIAASSNRNNAPTNNADAHEGNPLDDDSDEYDVLQQDNINMPINGDTLNLPNRKESIFITLTPETIYKGASVLKTSPRPDSSSITGEAAYQQLNATLGPVACFDSNILKLLPTEIVAFGNLVSDRHPDVFRISINGLHRWSSQFENHIWKYLGWDDWSDFTICSVQCGKGVQQRFRRCLLDNPMININMNMNGNEFEERQLLEQQESIFEMTSPSQQPVQPEAPNQANEQHHHQVLHSRGGKSGKARNKLKNKSPSSVPVGKGQAPKYIPKNNNETTLPTTTDSPEPATSSVIVNKSKKRRKRKKAKTLSTLSCEGYNIEQRNCNTFECTDDISDLLKFYKKFLPLEDLPTTSAPQQPSEPLMQQFPTVLIPEPQSPLLASSSGSSASTTSTAASTLPNTGFIRGWKNALNFTLMITLRLKNDTKSTLTVFSVRNRTHNLYVETAADGLRLYQERDNATEMLPVKLQLYDNRWHQVAISFQNGDFISIYVDCSWTNSFIVSKRLFSLPTEADVEVGRGFSGELQQLLVLPDNQDRHQCSSVRTSINEVKRYIIDTFIEDYGN